jgi:hypothetical protein
VRSERSGNDEARMKLMLMLMLVIVNRVDVGEQIIRNDGKGEIGCDIPDHRT